MKIGALNDEVIHIVMDIIKFGIIKILISKYYNIYNFKFILNFNLSSIYIYFIFLVNYFYLEPFTHWSLLPTNSIVSPFPQEPRKYCYCHHLTGTQLSSGIDTIVYVCCCHQGFMTWHQLKDEEAKMEAQRSCARQGQGISDMAH